MRWDNPGNLLAVLRGRRTEDRLDGSGSKTILDEQTSTLFYSFSAQRRCPKFTLIWVHDSLSSFVSLSVYRMVLSLLDDNLMAKLDTDQSVIMKYINYLYYKLIESLS